VLMGTRDCCVDSEQGLLCCWGEGIVVLIGSRDRCVDGDQGLLC